MIHATRAEGLGSILFFKVYFLREFWTASRICDLILTQPNLVLKFIFSNQADDITTLPCNLGLYVKGVNNDK